MLLQTLLIEEVAKFETKYRDSHFSASFHNFIGASNHAAEQLLRMNEWDRRYVLINTRKLSYTKEQWAALWSRVKDDTIRELFWQFLRNRDVAHVQPGTAPMNRAKANAIAEQAPDTIRYLRHLCLVSPDDLQPRDTVALSGSNSRALPMAIEQHPDCLTLKDRPADRLSTVMTNLLGSQYKEAMLKADMQQQHGSYIRVPTAHLYHCIGRHIQGQRYTTINEGVFKRDLERIGLEVGVYGRVAGIPVNSTVALPSIQGLRYMIKRRGFMSDAELARADQQCVD